jgi:hypothetical protein
MHNRDKKWLILWKLGKCILYPFGQIKLYKFDILQN